MKSSSRKVKDKNHDVIPLYRKLEYQLRNQILSGQLEPGEQLPTLGELEHTYGVSKITVRNALAQLEAENLIWRASGKGTFVADEIPVQKQLIVTGSVSDIVADAARFKARTLDIIKVRVGETRSARIVRDFLKCSNDHQVGLVHRIRLLKDVPIYFLENYLPPQLIDHLSASSLNKHPLLNILKKEAGLKIGRGEMFIEAVPADPDVATILKCQVNHPLILMQVYYWYPSGEPFEVVNLFMRHDYFKYKIELDTSGFEST